MAFTLTSARLMVGFENFGSRLRFKGPYILTYIWGRTYWLSVTKPFVWLCFDGHMRRGGIDRQAMSQACFDSH